MKGSIELHGFTEVRYNTQPIGRVEPGNGFRPYGGVPKPFHPIQTALLCMVCPADASDAYIARHVRRCIEAGERTIDITNTYHTKE